MNTIALGPARTGNRVAALAGLLLALGIILQGGITIMSAGPATHVHVQSVFSTPSTEEGAPGHTHIQAMSPAPSNEPMAVVAMPRDDGKLLRSAIVAVLAVGAIGSAAILIAAPGIPRPRSPAALPIRHGRMVLHDICISRC
ncbi:putative copper homeostasis (lipo)protein LpqS [Rhodococcus spongiicola]|uniref:Lipoprotein LpqS n=1 Tax=Rhodococcus spongiicola TaxID=2487352 RepID=A0A3S3A6H3_9NOCA|nr:hypothetical protein [Rhodococcus spongiicola]RVW03189.1 hypothetical protein EF834_08390 [Rhodococcus spongiicola]